ncbi:heterokaryon incompatibility protein-domain-containing protein, partial [Lophiotrema nucula]
LVDGTGLHGEYATLSHCWGTHRPLNTEERTIAQRRHGILDTKLPRTFRGAVVICRELKIRYLWINSLCIIQDSRKDWAKNAPRMGDVYSNPILTIVVSVVVDNTEGYFKDRILDQRAWILQEQVLATRTLNMGRKEMSWLCSEHVSSIPRSQIYDFWYRTVMDFTGRKLTYRKDKLAAIAGLANRYGATIQDNYFAGMWKNDILISLLWRSGAALAGVPPTKRVSDGLAPSLSWASLDGFVDY